MLFYLTNNIVHYWTYNVCLEDKDLIYRILIFLRQPSCFVSICINYRFPMLFLIKVPLDTKSGIVFFIMLFKCRFDIAQFSKGVYLLFSNRVPMN